MLPLHGLIAVALLAPATDHVGQRPIDAHHTSAGAELTGPASIRHEHEEILETLRRATAEPGELGEAAKALAEVLLPHFRREEEIAVPPLGLLEPLSRGPVTTEMRDVLPMTQALEKELPGMLAEHERVAAALERLEAAAAKAGREDYVAFARALAAHARLEEEVLYPAAVLVGRYVAGPPRR